MSRSCHLSPLFAVPRTLKLSALPRAKACLRASGTFQWGAASATPAALHEPRIVRMTNRDDYRRPCPDRRPHLSGPPPHAEPGGRRQPHPGGQLFHGPRHFGAAWRPGALAQPGAGGDLLHRRRAMAKCAWARSAERCTPGRRSTFRIACSISSPTPAPSPCG